MIYDFTKADDVIRWFKLHPQRHGPQLKWLAVFRPQFAGAIKEAGERLRSSLHPGDPQNPEKLKGRAQA